VINTGPGFSSDIAGDGPTQSLKCASFNCGGLSIANAPFRIALLGQWMLEHKVDVLAVQDTRLQAAQHKILIDQLRVILKHGLGPSFHGLGDGVSVLASHAGKLTKTDSHVVGGQLFILAPSLAGCVVSTGHDQTELGLIYYVDLIIQRRKISITSVYVPFPATANDSINRLYNKASSLLIEQGYPHSVYQYIEFKIEWPFQILKRS
jgi:exonuclease III